ncbi:MAG: hypothetical protein K9J06_15805 [Flavobacteriales bacterium]|nr:hypothetical protein [Flavobacteriales bacterium]
MKKYLAIICIPLMLIGCDTAEKEKLQAEVDRLALESTQKDTDIDGFISSLTNIQDNLDSIKTLEGIVTAKAVGEAGKNATAEDDILGDMRSIYDKMRKNREQISNLEKRLKESSISSDKLTKLIAKLKADLADKDTEISVLRDKLAQADIYIDALMTDIDNLALEGEHKTEVIEEKDRILTAKEKELQTAYWVKGTKKDLMERGIIDREGAFLGMGGVKKVAGDVHYEDLIRINIYETTEFAIGAKKAEIVSTHPSSTFEVVGNKTADKLVVSDADAFWKNSKVLVIVTN